MFLVTVRSDRFGAIIGCFSYCMVLTFLVTVGSDKFMKQCVLLIKLYRWCFVTVCGDSCYHSLKSGLLSHTGKMFVTVCSDRFIRTQYF